MSAREESIEVEGYGLRASVKSKDILIFILFTALVGLGYLHHIHEENTLSRLFEAMAENTYLLSLPQAEREKLNLRMPDSLRRKIREHE